VSTALFFAVVLGLTGQARGAIVLESWGSSVQQNNTAAAANFSATPTEGNLLIAIVGNVASTTAPATPSGWTLLRDDTGNAPGQLIYYKIAGAAEPTNVTIGPYPATLNLGMQLYEYSGVDAVNPLDSTIVISGSSATVATGNLSTSADGSLILAVFTATGRIGYSGWTNSFVEEWDFANGGAPAGSGTYAGADLAVGAAGTYSTSATLDASAAWIGHALVFNPAAPPVVSYIVTNTGNSGVGSLRAAIDSANLTSDATISFDILDTDPGYQTDGTDHWWRIALTASLPLITSSGTIVDGFTQTANRGDVNTRGPEVEINGASIPTATGLTLTAADGWIRGIVVNGFTTAPGAGILVDGASATGNRVTGCYIGTNAVGDGEDPNFYGIVLSNGASGTVIGEAGEGNVISGSDFYGIEFDDAGANTTIQGNRIGTNAAGDAAIPNSQGLYIDGGTDVVIGGPGIGEGNLISGNTAYGMNLQTGTDITIQGNWMGLNLAGTDPLPDGGTAIYGWAVDNVTIGGSAPGEGNIIAGNDGYGISLAAGPQYWVIQGNTIGAGPLGTETHLGNTGAANIRISNNDISINATIGGANPGEGNLIAYASGPGIDCISLGSEVEIIGNVIRNNSEEGIVARADNMTVAMNTIHDNGSGFDTILIMADAADGKWYQNTIHGSGDDGIEVMGLGHEIRNNIITGSAGYGINVNAGTMTESNNLVTGTLTSPANALGQSNVALDATDLSADPLYINAAGGDFALTECSSPAINTGLDLGAGQPDLNGTDPGNYNGSAPDRGAFETACVATDSDGDGLWDNEEDANADLDNDPSTNPGPDTDGDTFANYLDSDDDGDGTPTASENADPNADGDPRDALDADHDGQPDYLDDPTGVSDGTVNTEQKISSSDGGLGLVLDDSDFFGSGVGGAGDLDGDGVNDIVVGAEYDGDGGTRRGAVYVLFLNSDGTVGSQQKISDLTGGLGTPLVDSDYFGAAVAGIGDIDGDGVPDIAVGAAGDDDGGAECGAVYVLFLNADGTVKSEQKISANAGGFTGPLTSVDRFGGAVAGIGDLDGDGVNDLAVGAYGDDDGGSDRGAVYVLFLAADGTVKSEQKISSAAGGFGAVLSDSDFFGTSVGGLGDFDADGLNDLVIGANGDDDGGTFRGAVYVLFLNGDGTVKDYQKISSATGGLPAVLDDTDLFGTSVVGIGDVDADGVLDVATGAYGDDDGGNARGAAYLLFLNGDATVKSVQKFSATAGGFAGPLDDGDYFGMALGATGDLDGGGTIDLAVGVERDDDGGTDRGAVYVLNLAPPSAGVDLEVVKTVGDGTPDEGQSITYTVTVTNKGPDAGTGISVTDLLPAGVTYVSDTPSQGSYVSGTGVWTVGGLANAANATLDITATVDAGTAGSSIDNLAAVSTLDQTDPVVGNDSDNAGIMPTALGNCAPATGDILYVACFEDQIFGQSPTGWTASPGATGVLVTEDGLARVLTDGTGSGAPVTSGDLAWSNVSVSQKFRSVSGTIDHAGVIARYVDDSNMVYGGIITATTAEIWNRIGGTWTQIGGTWTIPDVSSGWHTQELRVAGGQVSIYIDGSFIGSGTLMPGAPSAGRTGFWSQYGGQEGYRDDHVVRINNSVDLQVTKTVDDGTPNEGQSITYSVTVTNNGPIAGSGIAVTDLLPAGVTYVSDTPSQGSYASGTGIWTVGGLANAANATLDITATVDAGTAGTSINNNASVSALDQTDPVGGNDSDLIGITVQATISGVVFEDADFAGTATAWDNGIGDLGLDNVDVELYDGLDAYVTSVTTTGSGTYTFTGLSDGTYKVRVRSATIGDPDTPPAGGYNATVPGSWPYPLPEMTWANGAASIGGQDHTVDDTATGDNAGPGDTYVTVTVSGADLTGVDFGFSFEVIVNEADDANADNVRSKQGTLRQFIKNSNAIVGVNKSWFQNPGP
jgi:uncharacterized repeat protein (TIGR01451 family)